MLQNIAVGSPMVAMAEAKSNLEGKFSEKDFKKNADSDSSFKETLGAKLSKPERPEKPERTEKQESTRGEMRSDEKRSKPEAQKEDSKEAVKPEGQGSKKASTRQKAIQEFMDSFESEFEIPPTRLVEAMANLDDAELTKSPEETVNAVIQQLDLDDNDAEKARAMYAALLVQLQQTSQPPKPVPLTETTMNTGVGAESMQLRIAAAQNKQAAVTKSVDKINDKFWMRSEPKATATPMGGADPMGSNLAQRLMMDESSFAEPTDDVLSMAEGMEQAAPVPTAQPPADMPKMEELPPHLQGQMKESLAPGLLAALAARKAEMAAAAAEKAEGAQAQGSEEVSADLMQEFSDALKGPKGTEKPLDPQALQALMQKNQMMQQQDSQGQSFLKNSQEFFKGMANPAKAESAEKLVTKAGEFKHSLTGIEGLQAQPIKGESLRMDPLAMAGAPAPTGQANPADSDAAVKQLMNQAQYLIKKGGGEVKVEMTPEGMGTIHLKVMMQDGKVNLHMAADTQEAKKTIETGLADLKTSLAAHKLSVENVKIDVVNNVSTDTATQNQNNMNNGNGQQREARQFWNQFNENFGSQGRRESYSELPGLKSYGRRRDDLQPIEVSSKERPRAIEGKGSGLNLVA
ncbi:flagellar hook-length control protein FliK [Bdellovibrio sp. HCB2-146]|uniref:flagellar hook-length control protein FliK n=1 Tax=Bdellovibrio sp. HCB2-146 TaxID=3394362 RepID=UPI0039BCE22F